MRKLVVHTFVSLDGVMQSPGGPDEDRDGGFEHGGWVVPHVDEQMANYMTELVQRAGALLLGRKTYDIFAGSWPLLGDDDPIAAVFNHIPKYVVSRSLTNPEWNNTTVLSGDPAEAIANLKEQPGGEIQVPGSSALLQTLLRHDLIDELHLLTFPVLIGTGKRLFGEGTIPGSFRLTANSTTSTGVTINTYERAGELTYGAMGPELEGDRP